jgi:hypothetical protein
MIDPSVLKVGDIFYKVVETNSGFYRNKIRQVIDGVEWFRYDKPVFSYSIVECTVIGILKKNLEGVWDQDIYSLETEWCILHDNDKQGESDLYTPYDFTLEDIFIDKAEALLYKETMELKAKEIDRK